MQLRSRYLGCSQPRLQSETVSQKKKEEKQKRSTESNSNVTDLSLNILVTVINVNSLNVPIKHRLAEIMKKHNPTMYCVKAHFEYSSIGRLTVKG